MARGRRQHHVRASSRSYDYRPDGKRITICTVDEEYIGEFARGVTDVGEAEASSADGSLVWPTAIALNSEGKVYVVDELLNRISIFTEDGEYTTKWERPGNGDGEWDKPSGLAIDKDDNVYLVDTGNNRVQKLTKDGQFISKWGQAGDGDGEFNMPWGITVDNEGNILVADWRNDRIQKFSSEGQFLMKFGTPGSGDGELSRPTSVAVDKDGYIYVADWGNDRVQVFSADGEYVTQTPVMASSPSGARRSWTPTRRCGRNGTLPRAWNGKSSSGARWPFA